MTPSSGPGNTTGSEVQGQEREDGSCKTPAECCKSSGQCLQNSDFGQTEKSMALRDDAAVDLVAFRKMSIIMFLGGVYIHVYTYIYRRIQWSCCLWDCAELIQHQSAGIVVKCECFGSPDDGIYTQTQCRLRALPSKDHPQSLRNYIQMYTCICVHVYIYAHKHLSIYLSAYLSI